jgi:phage baseplate assembly protein W
MMPDLSHEFGADLEAGPTGDLAVAQGAAQGRQRVLRRLLTNPGDYIWQPEYGAGLGRFVGSPAAPERIRAVVRSQIFREPAVARSPEPVVEVQADGQGRVFVAIRYADADSGETQSLSFRVGEE